MELLRKFRTHAFGNSNTSVSSFAICSPLDYIAVFTTRLDRKLMRGTPPRDLSISCEHASSFGVSDIEFRLPPYTIVRERSSSHGRIRVRGQMNHPPSDLGAYHLASPTDQTHGDWRHQKQIPEVPPDQSSASHEVVDEQSCNSTHPRTSRSEHQAIWGSNPASICAIIVLLRDTQRSSCSSSCDVDLEMFMISVRISRQGKRACKIYHYRVTVNDDHAVSQTIGQKLGQEQHSKSKILAFGQDVTERQAHVYSWSASLVHSFDFCTP
ncbi:hypothetical protein KCU66_g73, partial [Aureobasidium melanogenum]